MGEAGPWVGPEGGWRGGKRVDERLLDKLLPVQRSTCHLAIVSCDPALPSLTCPCGAKRMLAEGTREECG